MGRQGVTGISLDAKDSQLEGEHGVVPHQRGQLENRGCTRDASPSGPYLVVDISVDHATGQVRTRQLVRILDERTLALPDRRGNDRIDSLRNIIRDPRVALMVLIPGHGNALRINGQARLTADAALRESFMMEGRLPRSIAIIRIETIYFQCARAILRAKLWEPAAAQDLPTPGQILAAMTEGEVGGARYDAEWPGRAAASMW